MRRRARFWYHPGMTNAVREAQTREERQFIRMTRTPVGALVARLAVPTVISMLVSAAYNITDTFYVAGLGPSAAGAVGVVFSLMSLIQALGMGVGMGAASLVSRALGRREDRLASQYVSSAFFFGALIGLGIFTAGRLTLTPLMRALGSTETILPYACAYAHYILLAAPVMCAAFVLNATLRSEGQAVFSMIGLSAGALLNIAVAPLFIYTFKWGIAGAAIAVGLCQTVSLGILLSFFIRRKSVTVLSWRLVSRNWRDYWDLIRTGCPTTFRQGFAAVATALLNVAAAPFGDAAVAAISIATKIYLALRGVVLGIGQAFQPVAGYNFGAKLYGRVHEAFWKSTFAATLLCTLCAAGLVWGAKPVMSAFRTGSEEVVAIGVVSLYLFAAALPFMPYSTYVNQMLQILGRSKSAAFLASCRQGILFLPLIFTLPRWYGLFGVQSVQPLADVLTFFVSIPFLVHFFRLYPASKKCRGPLRRPRLRYLVWTRKIRRRTESQ